MRTVNQPSWGSAFPGGSRNHDDALACFQGCRELRQGALHDPRQFSISAIAETDPDHCRRSLEIRDDDEVFILADDDQAVLPRVGRYRCIIAAAESDITYVMGDGAVVDQELCQCHWQLIVDQEF